MPLYEYECAKDGRFELIRRFSDPPLRTCPKCGRSVEKMVAAPAFQFKGSGWYVTDYAKKSKTNGDDEAKTEGKTAESKKADSKPSDSSTSKDAKDSTPITSTSKESSASKGSSPT